MRARKRMPDLSNENAISGTVCASCRLEKEIQHSMHATMRQFLHIVHLQKTLCKPSTENIAPIYTLLKK